MRRWLFIPCYNCAPQIVRVLEALKSEIPVSTFEKILLLDNGSTDGTLAAAREALRAHPWEARVELRTNLKNLGLGGSHKEAIRRAQGEGVDQLVVLHGDDQALVCEILELLEVAGARPELTVLGSRFMPGSALDGYQSSRVVGNRVLNLLFTLATHRATRDLGSGLNVLSLEAIDPAQLEGFSDGFTFNVDLLLYLYRRGAALQFVPITWRESDQRSNARNFRVAWQMIERLRYWLSRPA